MEEDNNKVTNTSDPVSNEETGKPSVKSEIVRWLKDIVLAFIIAFIITHFIIVNAMIPTGSMIDTIPVDSRVIGSRLQYVFSEPQRGDIVVFRYPDNRSVHFAKRLIGLPGDIIEFVEDEEIKGNYLVYVNGEKLDEPYLYEGTTLEYGRKQRYLVPDGYYFLLGDNRNDSLDSRYWENIYVPKADMEAKVIFKYWKGFEWLADK